MIEALNGLTKGGGILGDGCCGFLSVSPGQRMDEGEPTELPQLVAVSMVENKLTNL